MPKIAMFNAKYWLEWCKAHRPPLDFGAVEICSPKSLSGSLIILGLAHARGTLPTEMRRANSKVWWRSDNGLGLVPLVPVMVNVTAFKDILDY